MIEWTVPFVYINDSVILTYFASQHWLILMFVDVIILIVTYFRVHEWNLYVSDVFL